MAVEERVLEEKPRRLREELAGRTPTGRHSALWEQGFDVAGARSAGDGAFRKRAEKLGDLVHERVPEPPELVGREIERRIAPL